MTFCKVYSANKKKKMDLQQVLNDEETIFFDVFLPKYGKDSNEYKLLDVLSYGSWKDYKALEASLPDSLKLKPNAQRKLKALTLLSHFQDNSIAKFSTLKELIDEKSDDELENIVLYMQNMHLIRVQIKQIESEIECLRCCSRCIHNTPQDIDKVIANIQQFKQKVSDVTSQK